MVVTVTFSSPADERDGPVCGPYEWVQLTYDGMRIAPHGDDLAYLVNNRWRLRGTLGPDYSDVVIGPVAPEPEPVKPQPQWHPQVGMSDVDLDVVELEGAIAALENGGGIGGIEAAERLALHVVQLARLTARAIRELRAATSERLERLEGEG